MNNDDLLQFLLNHQCQQAGKGTFIFEFCCPNPVIVGKGTFIFEFCCSNPVIVTAKLLDNEKWEVLEFHHMTNQETENYFKEN